MATDAIIPPAALPPLIDTHCHLDVEAFDADRATVLARTLAAGVHDLVVPAILAATWPELLRLCRQPPVPGPRLHPALGLHPVYLDRHRPADLPALERAIAASPPLAIGEIGLDAWIADADLARQQALFAAQLDIARAADLPVLLHVRKAHEQTLACLRDHPVRGGLVHAFNGSLEQARRYLDLGFRLGFGGMLTFSRSTRLRRLAAALPATAMVLETDAPDLTVAAHRGERNSPEYLPQVLDALAEARGESRAELARHTTNNATAVLGPTLSSSRCLEEPSPCLNPAP